MRADNRTLIYVTNGLALTPSDAHEGTVTIGLSALNPTVNSVLSWNGTQFVWTTISSISTLSWTTTGNQTGLTGTKSGSYNLSTTGNITCNTLNYTALNPPIVLTGFVPYTGATGNVDLGVHSLIANEVDFGSVTGVAATALNGVLTLQGKKAAGNNETLTLDFENVSNQVDINTTTGVTNLQCYIPQFTIQRNAIGSANPISGYKAENITAATNLAKDQDSPAINLSGTYWDGAASQTGQWWMKSASVNAGLRHDFYWYFQQGAGAVTRHPFILGGDRTVQYTAPSAINEAHQPGFQSINAFAATNVLDQFSPATFWWGAVWETATGTSKTVRSALAECPEQSTNGVGVLKFYEAGIGGATPLLANEIFRVEWGDRLGFVLNDLARAGYKFRVEGNSDANLIYTDGANNRVGIGTASPTVKLDVNGQAIVSSSTFPPFRANRTGQVLDLPFSAFSCISTKASDAGDGFGSGFVVEFTDTGGTFTLGQFAFARDGGDRKGRFVVQSNNGTVADAYSWNFQVRPDGTTYIGNAALNTLPSACTRIDPDGTLHVVTDIGMTVGTGSDFQVSLSSDNVLIDNVTSNKNITVRVNKGGVTTDLLLFNGTAGSMVVNDSVPLNFRDSAIGIYSQSDTFMDLFADGSVRIGNSSAGAPTTYLAIDPSADTYWVGDGSGIPYGSCYGNEIGWVQAAAAQNVWYNISDTDMTDGNGGLNLVTHDGSGKLTVTKGGRYQISYNITLESTVNNEHVLSGIELNDTGTAIGDGQGHLHVHGANEEVCMAGMAIVDLAANGTIQVSVSTTDAGGPTISVSHLNIVCFMVGGT